MSLLTIEGYPQADSEVRSGIAATGVIYTNSVIQNGKPFSKWSLQVTGEGAAPDAWEVEVQTSLDGTNYQTLLEHKNGDEANGAIISIADALAPYYRVNVVALTLGSATGIRVAFAASS